MSGPAYEQEIMNTIFSKKRASRFALHLIFALAPTILLYLVFELILFKPFLPLVPLRYQQYLPEPLQMLSQPSKQKTMPHDYVLILGDSYAAGWGDWFMGADIGKNPPYASHDLLHQLINKDVVQSGFAGGSPMDTLIRKPINRYRYLRKMLLYKPEEPKKIVWIFNESNDFLDNINRFHGVWKGKIDESRLYDKTYFRNFLDTEVLKSDALYYDVRKFYKRWYYQLPMFYLIRETAYRAFEKHPVSKAAIASPTPALDQDTNIYQTLGGARQIENRNISCPPMTLLTADEFKMSVYVTGMCLDRLRDFFPHSEMIIVYVPSAVTSYPMISKYVAAKIENQENSFIEETSKVFAESSRTFEAVSQLAYERGISLIDTRPALHHTAASVGPVHGPKDWHHFNHLGYQTLAQCIADHIDLENENRPSLPVNKIDSLQRNRFWRHSRTSQMQLLVQ